MKRDALPMHLTYGSVCSGIEAATAAWHRFGWRAAWLAEIEPNPARILNHHYGSGRPHFMPSPDEPGLKSKDAKARRAALAAVSSLPLVPLASIGCPPNVGDMTKIAALVRSGVLPAPDVLVGGTPCQAFSIAGLRASLCDARGQLTLSFVDIANAIDTARHVRGDDECIIVWENVPGVLSTADNAFGNFLGALAGEDCALVPPGGKWPNAGCVVGPQRTVAWRVLDAQYFGVAQRRRRVFVVASARKGFDPTTVLFEFDGMRRDIAPSREAREDVTGTLSSRTTGGGGLGTDFECAGGLQAIDLRNGRLTGEVAHTLQAGDHAPDPGGTPHVLDAYVYQPRIARTGRGVMGGAVSALTAQAGEVGRGDGSPCVAIAFGSKDHGADALLDLSPTLRAGNHHTSHANGGQPPAIAYAVRTANTSANGHGISPELAHTLDQAQGQAVCITGDITHTLKAEGFDASEDGAGRGQPIVTAIMDERNVTSTTNRASCRADGAVPTMHEKPFSIAVQSVQMAVRRLMPVECERLQGFPDDYTLVPLKQISKARAEKLRADGEPVLQVGDEYWSFMADGPRYKALGNSMAVPCMAFIGSSICIALGANGAAANLGLSAEREVVGREA